MGDAGIGQLKQVTQFHSNIGTAATNQLVMAYKQKYPESKDDLYLECFKRAGVPDSALTFVNEHTKVDLGHNRLMEEYVGGLVESQAEVESIVYSMRVTGHLYAAMMDGAFAQADAPRDWGVAHHERLAKSGRSLDASATMS